MRLVVILTLGLGACGPAFIDAEKVVFVVPRYVKRSYTSSAIPFYNRDEHSYKMRHSIRGTKRPSFGGHYARNPINNGPFFPGEDHRVLQGGDDFDPGFFAPNREADHVVIPHGKGISHGLSFGKGYIPRDEFKGGNENYEFPSTNGNNVEYTAQNHQGDVNFEDEDYSRFQNQDQATGTRNADWSFTPHESGYTPVNYDQETNREEPRLELQEAFKSQGRSSAAKDELFLPKSTGGQEPRVIFEENASQGRISGNVPPPGAPGAPVTTVEHKLTPIVLHDTVDMRDYVQKIEAFARSWPPAAGLRDFGWKNQILNPPGLTIPNYQGFDSWSNGLPRRPSGSYEVQEDTMEGPSRRSFRTVIM